MLITDISQVKIGDRVEIIQDDGRTAKGIVARLFENGVDSSMYVNVTESNFPLWSGSYRFFFVVEGRTIRTPSHQLDLFEGMSC